ncbi:MAG: hypothetical protein ACI9WU_004114, partial [Myxococcota bacterium]
AAKFLPSSRQVPAKCRPHLEHINNDVQLQKGLDQEVVVMLPTNSGRPPLTRPPTETYIEDSNSE